MDLLFALIFSFTLLLICVTAKIFIFYPLLFTLIIFIILYLKRGYKLNFLLKIALDGAKQSFSVIAILLLIGVLISCWLAAGTVPALVFYGIKLIHPQSFVLWTFILSSFISILIGTSFGTVSTIGIALMLIAKESEVNLHLIAGAIIAGAYLGDRSSPMSSSAHLIASVTATKIYTNLKNTIETAYLPLLISSFFYGVLSWQNPVIITNNKFLLEIESIYTINLSLLIPASIILLFSLLRFDIKLIILLSIIFALAIAIFIQNYSWLELIQFSVFGYHLPEKTSLQEIFKGGGIMAMAKVSLVVLVSTALAGIFTKTKTLQFIETYFKKAKTRSNLFLGTIAISIASAAFGCTQTIAILLTQQLISPKYEQEKLDNYQIAVDLENSAVVLSPLIPWNIASFVPATLLMTDIGFIPYAFYLYLIPLLSLIGFNLNRAKN